MKTKSLRWIGSAGLGALLVYMGRRWRRKNEERKAQVPEEVIDKTLADSFPTSDPPSWNMGKEPR